MRAKKSFLKLWKNKSQKAKNKDLKKQIRPPPKKKKKKCSIVFFLGGGGGGEIWTSI